MKILMPRFILELRVKKSKSERIMLMKNEVEKKDLPTTHTEKEAREQITLRVAMKLAQQFKGKDWWQRYPNANQQKFQSLMLKRAREIVKLFEPIDEGGGFSATKAREAISTTKMVKVMEDIPTEWDEEKK